MYPKAYIDYLVYFHGPRDYFECHEVLEEYWKEDDVECRKPHWVGLIQIAVSMYHHRLGNFTGAKRLLKRAIWTIEQEKEEIERLSIDVEVLLQMLKQRYIQLEKEEPYTSMNLPISDKKLLTTCQSICRGKQWDWGEPSNLSDEFLIRKHSLRDRSEVILERERQQKKRRDD
jgi:predicted metal-dependent hydrolase